MLLGVWTERRHVRHMNISDYLNNHFYVGNRNDTWLEGSYCLALIKILMQFS